MNEDWEVEALRSLVSLPWITHQHFVSMLQASKNQKLLEIEKEIVREVALGG